MSVGKRVYDVPESSRAASAKPLLVSESLPLVLAETDVNATRNWVLSIQIQDLSNYTRCMEKGSNFFT